MHFLLQQQDTGTYHVMRESTQTVGLSSQEPCMAGLRAGHVAVMGQSVTLLQGVELVPECCNVSLGDVMTIPPVEVVVLLNIFSSTGTGFPTTNFDGYLEGNISKTTRLVVAYIVTSVRDGVIVACVLNPTTTQERVFILNGCCILPS